MVYDHLYYRNRFALGWPAFVGVLIIFYLMVGHDATVRTCVVGVGGDLFIGFEVQVAFDRQI